ncbi:MAG: methyltransferase domain-containing protein [Gemmatimonadaceae bacterium]|nr:methyltransferase domain-containing protein [Gemmatimonadaceae bacterium]
MTSWTKEITTCEVCGNDHLYSVLDLGVHPMCDDLVPVGDSRVCVEYPIEILFCNRCITAHQRFQVPKRELFPVSYHYRSRFTADVLKGMSGLTDACDERFGPLSGKTVLDIGCNDGSLLDFFRRKGAVTIGVEPTGAAKDAEESGHTVFNGFLSEDVAGQIVAKFGKPDFITFTNVFAHIENLGEVLASLRILTGPATIIVIENHYLGSVLDGNQFDTFYHEHPRTYSYTSFAWMARSLDLDLLDVEFPSRYGGNIRVFIGKAREGETPSFDKAALTAREAAFESSFDSLRLNVKRWNEKKGSMIANLAKKDGPLRAKAFPGRAAILVKLLGLDTETIASVHEKPGSLKIGHFVPGTRIPILSDDQLFAYEDQGLPLINLAWHIPGEIRGYLAEHGYAGEIVQILEAGDFG